jgi:uncharacterized RDD family membrane protein YckC
MDSVFPNLPKPVVDFNIRYNSARLDIKYIVWIIVPFAIPGMIYMFTHSHPGSVSIKNAIEPVNNGYNYLFYIGFALCFCKDCMNGQSIAKRLLRLQVVDNKTGVAANSLRCFVRNMFMVLIPVEGLMLLINPTRRLGDIVAGTKVVAFDDTLEQPKINYLQIVISFLLAYAFVVLMMRLTSGL